VARASAAVVAATTTHLIAQPTSRRSLTILLTNDLHGHVEPWLGWELGLAGKTIGGSAWVASVIKQVRGEAGKNVLLLDAGDAFTDTMLAMETRGAVVLDVMNHLGYDAMTLGNHEPDFGPERLRQLRDEAKFEFIAANLLEKRTGKLFSKPYVIREMDGKRIGILGLAYPNTPLTTAKKNVEDFEFQDAIATARRLVPEVRTKADVVVALTHLGLSADQKLAEAVPGIDVILGGHSHNRVTEPLRVGKTLIVQAGAHGSDVARLDIEVGEGVTLRRCELISVDHARFKPDAETEQIVARHAAPLLERMNERIAEAAAPLIRAQTLNGPKPERRDDQSPADSLFADVLREETGADVALLPGVGYGVAIPKGPITVAALRNLMPHASTVVAIKLTGKQLRDTIEQSIENTLTKDPRRKVGGMIQVSGLRFKYEPAREFGRRVMNVQVGDQELSEELDYRVATNQMLAAGGHNYSTLAAASERTELKEQFEMVRHGLMRRRRVESPSDRRILSARGIKD
jgi:5'-nucleotidase / UDP-sugar diphosphatase